VVIILRYRGCGVKILAAFWGTLFQLAVSTFNWINKVMEEVASRGQNTKEAREETTKERLKKKYPWWMPTHHAVEKANPSEKTEYSAPLFEGKNTRV
jgi:hypothetical protein